ncbi:hypothetical protein AMS68_003016 [Peltaster fructicola]|uniref:choline-phosphate cytidylyltransferase n=1 Tax=Peltaster fructicola TaxID=286661 RepID=A0A6H0XS98_9PEZI|nr:hypothetical protein AMS68_003016 [Peltaster fructicola]
MAPKRKRAGTLSKEANANAESSTAVVDEAVSSPSSTKGKKPSDHPSKRTKAAKSEETNGDEPIAYEGENGEAGSMRMEAPPKAGTVDPVGYHTNAPPEGRPVRIYADGVFDLFHLGHMRQLQQAKTAFPDVHLIVGVTGDAETHKRKGLTVLSAKERAESVRHCRWVDEVVEDCPWILDVAFLEKHKIDFVAHDDIPYGASEGDDIYKPIKEKGMFLVTQRTEGVSTTGIITKIVRDYEQYIKRQLQRGTSRQELNVSWFKKNEMDIKRHVSELRDNIRQNWTTTGQELSRELKQFWLPNSRPSSRPSSPAASMRGQSGPRSPTEQLFKGDRDGSGSVRERNKNLDFAAGYAMGLIGGVKGWMQGSDRRHLSDSEARGRSEALEEASGSGHSD